MDRAISDTFGGEQSIGCNCPLRTPLRTYTRPRSTIRPQDGLASHSLRQNCQSATGRAYSILGRSLQPRERPVLSKFGARDHARERRSRPKPSRSDRAPRHERAAEVAKPGTASECPRMGPRRRESGKAGAGKWLPAAAGVWNSPAALRFNPDKLTVSYGLLELDR